MNRFKIIQKFSQTLFNIGANARNKKPTLEPVPTRWRRNPEYFYPFVGAFTIDRSERTRHSLPRVAKSSRQSEREREREREGAKTHPPRDASL